MSELDKPFSDGTSSRLDPAKTTGAPLQTREGQSIDVSPNEDDVRAAGRDRQMKRQIDRQIRRAARRGGVKLALQLMGERKKVFGTSSPDSATISNFSQNREQDIAMAADRKRKSLLAAGAIDPRVNRTDDPNAPQGEGEPADQKVEERRPAGESSADAIASRADKPAGGTPESRRKEASSLVSRYRSGEIQYDEAVARASEIGGDSGSFDAAVDRAEKAETTRSEQAQRDGRPRNARLEEIRNRNQDQGQVDEIEAATRRLEDQEALRSEDEVGMDFSELMAKRKAEYEDTLSQPRGLSPLETQSRLARAQSGVATQSARDLLAERRSPENVQKLARIQAQDVMVQEKLNKSKFASSIGAQADSFDSSKSEEYDKAVGQSFKFMNQTPRKESLFHGPSKTPKKINDARSRAIDSALANEVDITQWIENPDFMRQWQSAKAAQMESKRSRRIAERSADEIQKALANDPSDYL